MRNRSMMKGYVISDKGNPKNFLGYNEQGEPVYVRSAGAIRYNQDIIYAVIFAFTSFTALYTEHFFNPQHFGKIMFGSNLLFKAWIFIWLASFLLYLYYIPYAIWRKSKGNWVSSVHENAWAMGFALLSVIYLIIYWTGNFHPSIDGALNMFVWGLLYLFGFFTVLNVWKFAIFIYFPSGYWRQFEREVKYQREMERRARAMEKVQQQKQQKPQNTPKPQPKQNVQMEVKDRLRRLKELLDEGLISEEDYKRKKGEILKEL